jgi:hypothetical protein
MHPARSQGERVGQPPRKGFDLLEIPSGVEHQGALVEAALHVIPTAQGDTTTRALT